MTADLSPDMIRRRFEKLRAVSAEARFAETIARRLREIRALYDLAIFMERAGTEAGLRRPRRR